MYLQTQILDKDVSSAELKLLTLAARIQDAEHTIREQINDAQTTVCIASARGSTIMN